MKSIIVDLWNGNIEPIKHCGQDNAELEELIGLIERNRTELNNALNEKQKDIFEKYIDCVDEYNCILREEIFCYGFSVGSKIMIEATKKDT